MSPEEAIGQARERKLAPLYLVVGEEQYLQTEVVRALRDAALEGGVPGLNDDVFDTASSDPSAVLSAARTLPMMAARRVVFVRSLERWEREAKGAGATPLDQLAEYAKAPCTSTTLILAGSKIDKRRRLYVLAQREGWLVGCDRLAAKELPEWVSSHAKAIGSRLSRGAAYLIADLCGPELGPIADALERVTLFVGPGNEVTEDAVHECIVRVRETSVWQLVGAVGKRDAGAALRALDEVYDPHDRGLRLVGVLAWSARQLLRFESAIQRGLQPPEAAKAAGAAPFKSRELSDQMRLFPRAELERWLVTLANIDLALKGGSRRPAKAVLEAAILTMCRAKSPRRTGAGGARA